MVYEDFKEVEVGIARGPVWMDRWIDAKLGLM